MLSLGNNPNKKIALSFGRHLSGIFKISFVFRSLATPSEIFICTTLIVRSVFR